MSSFRSLLPWFLVPALPLLVPMIAMRFTTEVDWSGSDFVVAYVLFTGTGLTYRLLTGRTRDFAYRLAAGISVAACLLLIWVNLAVGFIGDEDNPANLLYGGVILVGLAGSVLARGRARGMARTACTAAGVQFAVPLIAYAVWRPPFDANVMKIFLLNFVWVLLFFSAGRLFRHSAVRQDTAGAARA